MVGIDRGGECRSSTTISVDFGDIVGKIDRDLVDPLEKIGCYWEENDGALDG